MGAWATSSLVCVHPHHLCVCTLITCVCARARRSSSPSGDVVGDVENPDELLTAWRALSTFLRAQCPSESPHACVCLILDDYRGPARQCSRSLLLVLLCWRLLADAEAVVLSGNKDNFNALRMRHLTKHVLTVGGVEVRVQRYHVLPPRQPAGATTVLLRA